MSKVRAVALVLALSAAAAPVLPVAASAGAGRDGGACAAGSGRPALLVRVTGFRTRSGTVRVQSYGGDPDHYFDKGSYLKRIDVPVPPAGPLTVCLPVTHPGDYAVSVRHMVDGEGNKGKGDGGGLSGNPHVSVVDLLFKRKPNPGDVAVRVDHGPRVVPITLDYLQGASFAPVGSAG